MLHVTENTNINPVSDTDPASTTSVATKHSSSDTSRESFALPPWPTDSKTLPFSGYASPCVFAPPEFGWLRHLVLTPPGQDRGLTPVRLLPPRPTRPAGNSSTPQCQTDPASTTSVDTSIPLLILVVSLLRCLQRPIDSKTIPFSGFASLFASD